MDGRNVATLILRYPYSQASMIVVMVWGITKIIEGLLDQVNYRS